MTNRMLSEFSAEGYLVRESYRQSHRSGSHPNPRGTVESSQQQTLRDLNLRLEEIVMD